jgi:hypothetical protein
MIIFGFSIELARNRDARDLYQRDKLAEAEFTAYLNGVKDGMRMIREQDNISAQYLKASKEYNPKNIN